MDCFATNMVFKVAIQSVGASAEVLTEVMNASHVMSNTSGLNIAFGCALTFAHYTIALRTLFDFL